MKIVVAPDKFKGALSAHEAADNIAAGIRDSLPEVDLEIVPIADGGEGTAEVIGRASGGRWEDCRAHDAFDRSVSARYVWLPLDGTAVMEMCEVAGWKHLGARGGDIDRASTFGVGEMILDAAARGARRVIVGLGGSITNDGGFGMARALGFRFWNDKGDELTGPVSELRLLTRIERPSVSPIIDNPAAAAMQIIAAADVRNPLLGENGATRVFGPQKQASAEQVEMLENAMQKLADVTARDLGIEYRAVPGAGAAGGLGFGLITFCGAILRHGFSVVAEAIGLEARIQNADVIVTGEGSLDRQTLEGKGPAEVARLARKFGKRIFAIVGRTDSDPAVLRMFDGVYPITDPNFNEKENLARASELLRRGARKLAADLG